MLNQLATDIRSHLELCWEFSRASVLKSLTVGDNPIGLPNVQSTLMCRHSVLFTYQLLKSIGIDNVRVGGGLLVLSNNTPSDNFNIWGSYVYDQADGTQAIPHYWLEVNGLVMDLTGDQAGYSSVVLVAADQASMFIKNDSESKLAKIRSVQSVVNQWRAEQPIGMSRDAELYSRISDSYLKLLANFS